MHETLNIAVVGSGISGLSAAWLLCRKHAVTLYEKETWLGGHSNTIDVAVCDEGATTRPVDTGFIVYNTQSYPNLIALFDHLGVETAPTEMSFSVSLGAGHYEYSGTGIGGLFGQPRNAVRLHHLQMLADIARFFREAPRDLANGFAKDLSLADYLTERGFSRAFIDHHILPMAAAIWSTPTADVLGYPAASFIRFFANHGLLQIRRRPQWRTVTGGSREYVRRLRNSFRGRIYQNVAVRRVTRSQSAASIVDSLGRIEHFDAVVLATHADQALALLGDADDPERAMLGAFRYARNEAVVHSDPAWMPRRRRLWSAWNFIGPADTDAGRLTVSYWMNRLQPLQSRTDIFVTLNPGHGLTQRAAAFQYEHPMFDAAALRAQRGLWRLQGRNRTWFAGSYFGYGFHEDGLEAGLAVAEELGGIARPWKVRSPIETAPRQAASALEPVP